MRIFFVILVVLHGLIHLIGLIKAFGVKEVKELTIPVSKPIGLFWLSASALFLIYAILYISNNKYAWLAGLAAVFISQVLIILYWKDARFGTIANVIILMLSITGWGNYNFQQHIRNETSHLLSENKVVENGVVQEKDFRNLPEPVKKWLHHSGVVGKPFISLGKIIQEAQLKMKPGQKKWMGATAIQYTCIDKPAFIWVADVKMNALINFRARDKFENGKGEMLVKINSLFNIVNEHGEKLNEGALQRYLGEMVWFPSMALKPYIKWEQINDSTAKASINFKGSSGSGMFYFNDKGDITKFTALRYKDNDAHAKRYNWVMDILAYKIFEGIKVPSKLTSTWKLDEGDWTWLELEVTDITYNSSFNL